MEVRFDLGQPVPGVHGVSYHHYALPDIQRHVVLLQSNHKYLVLDDQELAWFETLARSDLPIGALASRSGQSPAFRSFLYQLAGVLSQDAAIRDHPRNTEAFSVKIDLTYRCNIRCSHCFQSDEAYGSHDQADIDQLMDFTRKLDTVLPSGQAVEFLLSGGEAFLYGHIRELVRAIRLMDRPTSIVALTNGTLPEKIGTYVEDIDYFQFSLDGLRAFEHERRRRGACFGELMRSVAAVRTSPKGLGFNITVGKDNKQAVEASLNHFIEEQGLRRRADFVITKMIPQGRADASDCLGHREFSLFLHRVLSSYRDHFRLPRGFKFVNHLRRNCNIGQHLNVGADGGIWLCGFTGRHRVGEVDSFELDAYHEAVEAFARRTEVDRLPSCSACELRYHCKGDCKIFRGAGFACSVDKRASVLIDMANQRLFNFVLGG